jgi:ethanolamine ammonia-lyase large subunit
MPANPAYLMALPTKIDPMLGYLTTGFQDHVRIRDKFGYKVNDRMWDFFQQLGVIDRDGQPTPHFGDPAWVYLQYRRAKVDSRGDEAILDEARRQMAAVRARGVFLAEGRGRSPGDLAPALDADIRRIFQDAKQSLWAELTPAFVATIPGALPLRTQSSDRTDYILHPTTGEQFGQQALDSLHRLRERQAGAYDVQLVVSDGLNALAITDDGHLAPFLEELRARLTSQGYRPAPQVLVLTSGRVRAGYRIGEALFGDLSGKRSTLHIIGERPGTGHHTFSVYITQTAGQLWAQPGQVDHNITKVVSGIAVTALAPADAAVESVRLLRTLSRF